MLRAVLTTYLAIGLVSARCEERTVVSFQATSADGSIIHGQADRPAAGGSAAVILVAGTGAFDRDTRLGRSGTERDLVFKDLAGRLTKRGLIAVRFDKRGVIHGNSGADALDQAALATVTTGTQRDDLAAVAAWARSPQGGRATCIIFLAHSEGMAHVGRLAEAGAPAPALVIGVGAPMESPVEILRWQFVDRDAFSLEMMDSNGDGRITNAEVEANWRRTPSSFADSVDLLLSKKGVWTRADLDQLRKVQSALYEKTKADALARADTDPYRIGGVVFSAYEWWKSWFTDVTPLAQRLAYWRVPISLHYGDRDSQTRAERQIAAAGKLLAPEFLSVRIHSGLGHTLGEHALLGPMDERVAETLVEEAAAAADRCR